MNNVHLWSTFVRVDTPTPPHPYTSCSFICFPRALVVILKDYTSVVAAAVMRRHFNERTVGCLRKGNRRILLWESGTSPLIAWLSLSRSLSRSLHSHVCRQSLKELEARFRAAVQFQKSTSFCFSVSFFVEFKASAAEGFVTTTTPTVPFCCDRHGETRNKPSKVAEGLNGVGK